MQKLTKINFKNKNAIIRESYCLTSPTKHKFKDKLFVFFLLHQYYKTW